jgi:phosphoribosylformylglycinamidine synthase
MAYAFHQVGFECVDVNLRDLQKNTFSLTNFRGIVWVGGFTFSDVLGAAEGWFQILSQNIHIKQELENFYHREDTFSLGVCNGCQLMARLGWVSGVSLGKNNSGRFESRWSQVKIEDEDNLFFKDMKGLVLGIYTAHGEGKICVDSENDEGNKYPIKYVDYEHRVTEKYPMNPNGSQGGRAAILSPNRRHLAIMPHPERTILGWQVPYQFGYTYTPWFIMFKNMFKWCVGEEEYHSSEESDENI